jgi:hypothetical protein
MRRAWLQLSAWSGEVVAVVVAILLATWALSAQSTWSDVRHEVTLRNDPQAFSCTVVDSAATILTAFGGSCVAPTIGSQSLYITDIVASSSAASTVTADQALELKAGTTASTGCDTGTATVWASFTPAMGSVTATFTTPIKVGANQALCWMDAVAGSKTFIVNGYTK